MAFNLSKRDNVKVGIPMAEYCESAKETGISIAVIRAVDEVESAGSGFLSRTKRPKILFEGHYFYKILKKEFGLSIAKKAQTMDPTICYTKWTTEHYLGREAEYGRLAKATEICHKLSISDGVALRSASWGRYQIMGDNYKLCGYDSVEDMVEDMFEDESLHLAAFIEYIKSTFLDDELFNLPKNPKYYAAQFASGYNGPLYKRNNYDVKIANSFTKFNKIKVDCSQFIAGSAKAEVHVIDLIPGERVADPSGVDNTSLDDRNLTDSNEDAGLSSFEDDGALLEESPISPALEPEENSSRQSGGHYDTQVQVQDGNVKVSTTDQSGPKEKVAVVKPQPAGFWKGLWQRILAATGTNIGVDVVADKAQQVGALGLSSETWIWIGWVVAAATLIGLLGYAYSHIMDKRREEEITRQLIQANTTDSNFVQLIDPELEQVYRARGYKVITR